MAARPRQISPAHFRKLGLLGMIGWLSLGAVMTAAAATPTPTPTPATFPSYDEVRRSYVTSEAVLLDRQGRILHEVRGNRDFRRLPWVELNLISPALRHAVIAAEDQRFEDHTGVDWLALARAAGGQLWSSLSGGATGKRGASTISMQLAALLKGQSTRESFDSVPANQALTKAPKAARRGVSEKIRQVRWALELERHWNKNQILEAYLNLVSFRGELQGIAAASEGLFGKKPHGLDIEESLWLAALIRAPQAGKAAVEARACRLGREIQPGFDCSTLSARLRDERLNPGAIQPREELAPHLAARLRPRGEVTTTLDRDLQRGVLEILKRQVSSLRSKNVHDAAALVLDNQTGEVLAYVGGIGAEASARFVDGVMAERQAGSTLKPFLYGLALDKRYLTAASWLEDSPTDLAVSGGVYRPRNYDHEFHGAVTVRQALASSLNVPAVKTLELVGVENAVRLLQAMGFTTLRDSGYYGPSLALGSADVSLWDLTNAYRGLANLGRFQSARFSRFDATSEAGHEAKRVLSPGAAYVIADILADRESRAMTFGLENPLALRFWAAAKTGTSKDMRDNWCVGYSERFTTGVWVGNSSGAPMWNVSGIQGAGPAWAEITNFLHQGRPGKAPRPPRELTRLRVASLDGGMGDDRESRLEWFLSGTSPPLPAGATKRESRAAKVGIRYPVDGMIIAWDPDIPKDRQKVLFEATADAGKKGGLKWILNDVEVESAWAPEKPGDYRLSLVGPDGHILDRIRFEVR